MSRTLFFILSIFALLLFEHGFASSLNIENKIYTVELQSIELIEGTSHKITLSICNKVDQDVDYVTFSNWTEKLIDIYFISDQIVMVHGTQANGGNLLTILNMESKDLIDTIFAWEFSISPDLEKIIYKYRYPPQSPPLDRTDTLLFYDFSKTPEENIAPAADRDILGKGLILWPEINRLKMRYHMPAKNQDDSRYIYGLTWNSKSTKIAFFENHQHKTYLVMMDISNDLESPKTTIKNIVHRNYYKDYQKKRDDVELNGYNLDSFPVVRSCFNEDDSTIQFQLSPNGVFNDGVFEIKLKDSGN